MDASLRKYRKRLGSDILDREGWGVTLTKRGHLKLHHIASGQTVFGPTSPSCRRALKNLRAQLRRVEQGGKA